jgi:hypothetical protein
LPRVQANLNASLRELKDEVKNLDRDGKKSWWRWANTLDIRSPRPGK